MQLTTDALQTAQKRLEEKRAQVEAQGKGMAWLNAQLPGCPFEPYFIHLGSDGQITVYFHRGDGAEEIAAAIRQFLGVAQSNKKHSCLDKDSISLVTTAPCQDCVIEFIVAGAKVPENCQIIESPIKTYSMVCNT